MENSDILDAADLDAIKTAFEHVGATDVVVEMIDTFYQYGVAVRCKVGGRTFCNGILIRNPPPIRDVIGALMSGLTSPEV